MDARPGTGAICCPATSARWRSSPVRKSSPASCAAAIPASSSPAPNPRSRCLMGPTAVSSALITPSRSHNSVITARPAFGVNARSGAPIRGCRRLPLRCVSYSPGRCLSARDDHYFAAIIIQVRAAPICICQAVSPAYSRIRSRAQTALPRKDSRASTGFGYCPREDDACSERTDEAGK